MSDLTEVEVEVLRYLNGDAVKPVGDYLYDIIDQLEQDGLIKQAYVLTEEGKRALWSRTKYEGAKG